VSKFLPNAAPDVEILDVNKGKKVPHAIKLHIPATVCYGTNHLNQKFLLYLNCAAKRWIQRHLPPPEQRKTWQLLLPRRRQRYCGVVGRYVCQRYFRRTSQGDCHIDWLSHMKPPSVASFFSALRLDGEQAVQRRGRRTGDHRYSEYTICCWLEGSPQRKGVVSISRRRRSLCVRCGAAAAVWSDSATIRAWSWPGGGTRTSV